jgi:serine protease Do
VGVFNRKEGAATSSAAQFDQKKFDSADYYKLDDEIGEGLAVTSDGWILTTDFSKGAADSLIVKSYVVITKSKDVYEIDRVVHPGIDSYLFVHLRGAKDLPVKNFVNKTELSNSQSLVALNWRGESYLTSIVDKRERSQEVKSSDGTIEKMILANNLGDYFENAFIFSLNGGVVGFFDKNAGLIPLDNFQPLIKGLLEKKEKKLPALGVTYVNLENFAIKNPGYEKGALIYSSGKIPAVKDGSAAKAALLQAGDIITSVDNLEISSQNDLSDVIQKYSAGDFINVIYLRGGAENAVKIKLGELK